MTPAEVRACLAAFAWRERRQSEREIRLAWMTAALSRQRTLPALASLLASRKSRPLAGEELGRRRAEHAEIVERLGKVDGRRE